MSLLNKMEVTVTFPLGAVFHQDIVEGTYKQFLKMVKKLSCIQIDSKCNACLLCDNCQYYSITGKNFEGYPGVIFKKKQLQEDVFAKFEDYTYEIYLIGNCDIYCDYIEIFFKEYLRYRIFGIDFLIKKIDNIQLRNKYMDIKTLFVMSVIETTDFIEAYNNMIHYYNSEYECHYQPIRSIHSISRIKRIDEGKTSLNTKSIRKKGYIYELNLCEELSTHFLMIGVGKYNYLGGGILEISSKNEK